MRQLDVFQTYFDNKDNPLVGRVRFCTLQGAEQDVFKYDDGDYVNAGNILYTNSSGRFTEQIFLSDADYLLYFERYNGSSPMETDTDEDIWETVGVARNLYCTVGIDVASGYLQAVNTIADLRATTPTSVTARGGVKAVALLGYSSAGDKAPVNYIWNSASTVDDNNGSVIKANGVETGRWLLKLTTGIVNTRDFGVIPTNVGPNITNRTRMVHADEYAYDNGYILMAHESGCYDIGSLTIKSKFMMGANSIVACPTGYSATIEDADKSVHAVQNSGEGMTGTITIKGDTLYISQNNSYGNATLCMNIALRPTKRLVLDKSYAFVTTANALTYSDIDIQLAANQSTPMNLTNCRIFGDYKITSIAGSSFTNCVIKRSQFSSDVTVAEICSVCHNCRTERSFWDSQDDYEAFVASQNVNVYEKNLSAANLAATSASIATGAVTTLTASTTTTGTLTSTLSQLGYVTSTKETITMGFVPAIVTGSNETELRASIAAKIGTNTPIEGQMMLAVVKYTISGTIYVSMVTPIYYLTTPIHNKPTLTTPDWFWVSNTGDYHGSLPDIRSLASMWDTSPVA